MRVMVIVKADNNSEAGVLPASGRTGVQHASVPGPLGAHPTCSCFLLRCFRHLLKNAQSLFNVAHGEKHQWLIRTRVDTAVAVIDVDVGVAQL
jgi:hypothetical protein